MAALFVKPNGFLAEPYCGPTAQGGIRDAERCSARRGVRFPPPLECNRRGKRRARGRLCDYRLRRQRWDQSSSASRRTASAGGFLTLIQLDERRMGRSSRPRPLRFPQRAYSAGRPSPGAAREGNALPSRRHSRKSTKMGGSNDTQGILVARHRHVGLLQRQRGRYAGSAHTAAAMRPKANPARPATSAAAKVASRKIARSRVTTSYQMLKGSHLGAYSQHT
jgi:hypothetical protein